MEFSLIPEIDSLHPQAVSIGAALPVVVARGVDALKGQPTLQAIGLVGLAVLVIGIGQWGLNWVRRSLISLQECMG